MKDHVCKLKIIVIKVKLPYTNIFADQFLSYYFEAPVTSEKNLHQVVYYLRFVVSCTSLRKIYLYVNNIIYYIFIMYIIFVYLYEKMSKIKITYHMRNNCGYITFDIL